MEQRTRIARKIQKELEGTGMNFTQRETRVLMSAVLESIIQELKESGSIELRNFFSLRISEQEGFSTSRIDTGEEMQVEDYKRVNFRASKRLKDIINDR